MSIIDDILDLATIDAGGLELKLTPIKIQPVIEAAVLGVKERAGRLRLTLEISLADAVDEIVADESRIRQLLFNLLSNAVGFSKPEGTVRLSAWREDQYVNFLIEDDGVGIPYDAQKRVFDRFESDSHGSRHRGAGLGLSIAKSLVDLHNGEIQLESEPGAGTRVLVRVPEPDEQPNILQDYANTSSAGSIIAFSKHSSDLAPGDHGLICSFGAGYSVGSVIVKRA